jgi:hypothetical protein
VSDFVQAGYADRLDTSRAGIHIGTYPGTVTYEILISAISEVLVYGSHEDLYRRVQQTTLGADEKPVAVLVPSGTIGMSRTKRSVIVQPTGGRMYIINADALRDTLRGKILRATVSEVITSKTKTPATIL